MESIRSNRDRKAGKADKWFHGQTVTGLLLLATLLVPGAGALAAAATEVCALPDPNQILLYKGIDGSNNARFPNGHVKKNVIIRHETIGDQTLAWIKGTWGLSSGGLQENWIPARECRVTSYSSTTPLPDDLDNSQLQVPDKAFDRY